MPDDKQLRDLQSQWERLAKADPLWAILTDPAKKAGGWTPEDFFATGEREIESVMTYVTTLMPNLRRQDALDFGCGVGRLTQALAAHFESVIGIDISPTMIELARHYDRTQGRCVYILNAGDDLAHFTNDSVDFIYSNITLQHMPPRIASAYLREFVRLLRPGGLLLFQLPTHRPAGLRTWLSNALPVDLRRRRWGGMDMHTMAKELVVLVLETAGARVIDMQLDVSAGRSFPGLRYAVTK